MWLTQLMWLSPGRPERGAPWEDCGESIWRWALREAQCNPPPPPPLHSRAPTTS